MTLEVIIPNFAAGGFAFGNVDPDIADAMRDAVAEQYDLETPVANDLLRLELTHWTKRASSSGGSASTSRRATARRCRRKPDYFRTRPVPLAIKKEKHI